MVRDITEMLPGAITNAYDFVGTEDDEESLVFVNDA
jgi:hypothetical protein